MSTLPRTAHWIDELYEPLSPIRQYFRLRWWLRLDPPAIATLSEDGDHTVQDERGHLIAAGSAFLLHPHEKPWGRDDVLQNLLPLGASDLAPDGGGVFVDPLGGTWSCEETTFNGLAARRYRAEFPCDNVRAETVVWLDPETGLQFGREYVERNPESGDLLRRIVSRDFEYDAAPPEGIFDLPTPDQTLAFAQPDAEPLDLRHTLPALVIRAIEGAIERSNRAWSAEDFERFDQVWSYLPLPDDREQTSRARWEEAIRGQTERATWVSAIRSITRSDRVPMPVTRTIHRPVPCPGTYCIRARLQLEWPDGQIWVGNADFFVQERDGDYRLVHWTYPSEEIRSARARSPAA